jgi:hypothetical protein
LESWPSFLGKTTCRRNFMARLEISYAEKKNLINMNSTKPRMNREYQHLYFEYLQPSLANHALANSECPPFSDFLAYSVLPISFTYSLFHNLCTQQKFYDFCSKRCTVVGSKILTPSKNDFLTSSFDVIALLHILCHCRSIFY